MKERKKEELTMIFPSAKVRCFRFKEITLAKWSSVAAGSHGERIRHRRPCVLLPTCCPWHLVSGRRPQVLLPARRLRPHPPARGQSTRNEFWFLNAGLPMVVPLNPRAGQPMVGPLADCNCKASFRLMFCKILVDFTALYWPFRCILESVKATSSRDKWGCKI